MAGDTIHALSTPLGRGGIAIIRISGPTALAAAVTLTGRQLTPRLATLCRIRHDNRPIDNGLVIAFPAPASFTGEDMVEFHVHGGRAITQMLARALDAMGCRPAEPGEFSKRAFLNGKIDLTEAEAIADLIDAETEAQHAQALAQADGGLARLYAGWSEKLLHALAYLEASLDFADEDLPPDILAPVVQSVEGLKGELQAHLADAARGERLRNGVRIAILGAPNAGKSSLLNYLAKRQAAIVSATPGTTRDIIEVHYDLAGFPVILGDTAGIRETENEIEAQGMALARNWAREADVKLLLVDTSEDMPAALKALTDNDTIVAYSKVDLNMREGLAFSCRTGQGMEALLAALTRRVQQIAGDRVALPPTRERHRHLLSEALDHLSGFDMTKPIDLAAEDLRNALRALGRITGRYDAEAILDIIFRDFCIGK